MKQIGFIILTHDNPTQSLTLLSKLNQLYDFPPIAWHHDFSKSTFPESKLTANVTMVKDYVSTAWGTFSIVEAKLKALRLLYSNSSPKYYSTLSGADYPVKALKDVLHSLDSLEGDVFIRSALISFGNFDKPWKSQYYDRYCSLKLLFQRKNKNNVKVISQITLLRNPLITKYFNPFNKSLQCWGGDFWYTGTSTAAKYLLDYVEKDKDGVVEHYKTTKIPDESIFNTIFNNASQLRCINQNFRYIDWSEGLPHPKCIKTEDICKIRESEAHFARKFDSVKSLEAMKLIDANLNIY
jgi:hypothetical protein